MNQQLMCALDLGPWSQDVLRHSIELARLYRAHLTLVHVVEPIGVFGDALLETYLAEADYQQIKETGFEQVLEALQEQIKESIEENFKEISAGISMDVCILSGKPSGALLKYASVKNVNLLILGAKSTPMNRSMGSTAFQVLNSAHVPVLIVPILENSENPPWF
jgi:nucleotide-binding universal stress UspA family protein